MRKSFECLVLSAWCLVLSAWGLVPVRFQNKDERGQSPCEVRIVRLDATDFQDARRETLDANETRDVRQLANWRIAELANGR